MNLCDWMRRDISTVVMNKDYLTFDELHVERILSEQLQDKHPAQYRMNMFAKEFVNIFRHEQAAQAKAVDLISGTNGSLGRCLLSRNWSRGVYALQLIVKIGRYAEQSMNVVSGDSPNGSARWIGSLSIFPSTLSSSSYKFIV